MQVNSTLTYLEISDDDMTIGAAGEAALVAALQVRCRSIEYVTTLSPCPPVGMRNLGRAGAGGGWVFFVFTTISVAVIADVQHGCVYLDAN